MKKSNFKNDVANKEYDQEWIKNTWGWDDPKKFISTKGKNLRPRIKKCLELAKLKTGYSILDIGCGRGEIVLYCGRMGIKSYGIDYSKDVIEIAEMAKSTHNPKEKENINFLCGDIKSIQINEVFDRIFMLDILEHLHDTDIKIILKKCYEILKPNGFIIIHTLPNKWIYNITYQYIIKKIRQTLPKDIRTEKEKRIHINEMDIIHLDRILKDAGFKSRIWLHELLIKQAKWHKIKTEYKQREKIYEIVKNPFISFLYKCLAQTPLKLLIVNDIFAIAWKNINKPERIFPIALTERIAISILNKFAK